MVRVKICGLTSVDDTKAAVECGADAIGLNFVAASVRCLTDTQARAIREVIPPFVSVVGVFADSTVDDVQRLARRLKLDYVQLHGDESPSPEWAAACPVIRAIRLQKPQAIHLVRNWRMIASAILLDGPQGGFTFDWAIADEARKITPLPIIIAGGLNPENVQDAVWMAKPYAVDVASGVESAPGVKDLEAMRAFVRRARAAHIGGR